MRVCRRILFLAAGAALILYGAPLAAASDYAVVDEYARATPESAATSIASLTAQLTPQGMPAPDRARAIFTWITYNITYDVSCLGLSQSAPEVLRSRRAVCAGYATLFQALAEAAGLDAVVVRGVAKGAGPRAACADDGLIIHDWNAVKINDTWRLVDCAWGAGQLDENGRFSLRFEEHYFFTPPEALIFDHFPDDPQWQFLPHPLTREEFRRQAVVRPVFFGYGMKLRSHPSAWVEATPDTVISITAPSGVNLMATLERNGADLGEGLTFAQQTPSGYDLRVAPPRQGDYLLKVHARRADASDPHYDCAVEYRLHAVASGASFPKMYLSFQEEGVTLEAPLAGTLPARAPTGFRLRAPKAEDVLVFYDGQAARLAPEGDGIYAGAVALAPGEAIVFARYPGQTRHLALLRYLVK